jgi:hypothetical protein
VAVLLVLETQEAHQVLVVVVAQVAVRVVGRTVMIILAVLVHQVKVMLVVTAL